MDTLDATGGDNWAGWFQGLAGDFLKARTQYEYQTKPQLQQGSGLVRGPDGTLYPEGTRFNVGGLQVPPALLLVGGALVLYLALH